jgi:hypothetical protein
MNNENPDETYGETPFFLDYGIYFLHNKDDPKKILFLTYPEAYTIREMNGIPGKCPNATIYDMYGNYWCGNTSSRISDLSLEIRILLFPYTLSGPQIFRALEILYDKTNYVKEKCKCEIFF